MEFTPEQILGEPPGPRLDRWVAYHVLVIEPATDAAQPPAYSTDIAAAWLVVEKLIDEMPQDGFHLEFDENSWVVGLRAAGGWVRALTAPLAIVRAALLAHVRASKG
jgi:hypothetical protein